MSYKFTSFIYLMPLSGGRVNVAKSFATAFAHQTRHLLL
jgi:hypothetical protein